LPEFRQQIRPELLMRTFEDLHWVKSSDGEVRSHRTPQKKSKKRSIVRASQPEFGSPQQQQQLSRARLNRAAG
jgi:ssDNA-specific exonuclease RecJ